MKHFVPGLMLACFALALASGADDADKKDSPPAEKGKKEEKAPPKGKEVEKAKKDDPERKAPEKGKKQEVEPRPAGKSSLKVGGDLPGPLHPFNATGDRKGKFHCPISQRGLNPMVLVIFRDLDIGDGFKDLLRQLDSAIDKNPGIHLSAMAIYVPDDLQDLIEEDDKREATVVKLEDLAKLEPPLKHVVLALDAKTGVERFLPDDESAVTVFLQRKLRIEGLYTLSKEKMTAEAVKQIMADVAAKLGAVRK